MEKAEVWQSATAGAVAGAVSRLLVSPLDVLKIRFQLQLEPISRQVYTPHIYIYIYIYVCVFVCVL